jgi:prolyl-tRNA synthetase
VRSDKVTVDIASLASQIPARLQAFHDELYARALGFREEHTVRADTWEELVAGVETGFALALSCDDPACELRLKEATTATPRCIPFDGEPEEGACPICGSPSAYGTRVVFGRAY